MIFELSLKVVHASTSSLTVSKTDQYEAYTVNDYEYLTQWTARQIGQPVPIATNVSMQKRA